MVVGDLALSRRGNLVAVLLHQGSGAVMELGRTRMGLSSGGTGLHGAALRPDNARVEGIPRRRAPRAVSSLD
jgi:hypothetical protein